MGFLESLFGTTNTNRGTNTLKEADIASGNLMGVTGAQSAAQAGQAGQALGNQMGQQAATQGTQEATQAARTAGVNKGQAALLGGQQAGNLYTAGQQAGQGMGMQAYEQGANQQLAATQLHGNIGSAELSGGQSQMGNAMAGLSKLAGGASSMLSKGGITKGPAIVGEKGPEAVLPLNDRERTAQILEKIGLRKGAQEARSMCPTCGQEMKKKAEGKSDGAH